MEWDLILDDLIALHMYIYFSSAISCFHLSLFCEFVSAFNYLENILVL